MAFVDSLPHSQGPGTSPCVKFCNFRTTRFPREELLAPRPASNLQHDHRCQLSALLVDYIRICLSCLGVSSIRNAFGRKRTNLICQRCLKKQICVRYKSTPVSLVHANCTNSVFQGFVWKVNGWLVCLSIYLILWKMEMWNVSLGNVQSLFFILSYYLSWWWAEVTNETSSRTTLYHG